MHHIWMLSIYPGLTNCRGVVNHSRVAECTRLSPEGEYSGLARISSISLKNTMNTTGLEWFGLPECNTLRSLCAVMLKTEELEL